LASVEDRIRDQLAERLEIIEDGLRLIATNYHVPNAKGARGYIDILARDRHGTFVGIELKRSDKTAREALHEVFKYKELLQAERGINAADVSSMIVSTHWKELLTPFSRLKRSWDESIRGFVLELEEGTVNPVKAYEVEPVLDSPRDRGVTPVHVLFTVSDEHHSIRDLWAKITVALPAVGIDDIIGLTVSHPELPLGFYVALGCGLADDPRTANLDYLKEEIPDDSMEAPEGHGIEYRALDHILAGLTDTFNFEHFYPERLASVVEIGGWEVKKVWRHGIFAVQQDLYSDDDVLNHLLTDSGQSSVRTRGSARLGHTAAWTRARNRIASALFGNHQWSSIVEVWLNEVEQEGPKCEVAYSIYDLGDFLTTLVYGWPDQLTPFAPKLNVMSKSGDQPGRVLTGFLAWDGGTDKNLSGVVSSIYASPSDWHLKSGPEGTDGDNELLAELGISYRCIEFHELDSKPPTLCETPDGDEMVRSQALGEDLNLPGSFPMHSFFEHYGAQLEELVRYYRAHMYVDLSAGFQIVTNIGQKWD
jgi:hypothetical protein